MRERAGLIGASLEIESAPGQGTTVLLRLDAAARANQPFDGAQGRLVDHA
jgi:nitrate/nitrite-specific signal transduction histidine kinase